MRTPSLPVLPAGFPVLPVRPGTIPAALLFLAVSAGSAAAQEAEAGSRPPVRYEVSFPNAVHHEAEVSVTFPELPAGPLEVWMSRASPGRYALHEFAKNVYDVRVDDGGGRSLPVERPDPYRWRIRDHDGRVRFRYTLFADRADGTYSQVDGRHAHLNMPATFAWAEGLEERPVEIRFRPPPGASGWRVATQLFPTDDPMAFTAPDRAYFLDSPTELSDLDLREWEARGPEGAPFTVRLAVHHRGTESDVDAFAASVRRAVEEELAVFGTAPAFETGTYTFIADYGPWASGDGMEHRNSTILTSRASLAEAARGLLGTVAHEFFHAWNVERLRPAALEPFDFTRANPSRELWFAEGFTSYYGPLVLRRAGFLDDAGYAARIGGAVDRVVNAPGRRFRSPVEMSFRAPFVDAATSVDPTNRGNTFLSYYTWGSTLGLALDLELRGRFDRTLDGYMRRLWRTHGAPETPYGVEDLERALGEFTGDPRFAAAFFDRFVRGREVPDFGELLAPAGFLLRKAHPGEAVLGAVRLAWGTEGGEIRDYTLIGTPLYEAGLDRGDVLVALDGRPLREASDLADVLRSRRPGDRASLTFLRGGERRETRLTLAENPELEVVTYEAAGRDLAPEARAFRDAWLGSRVRTR